MSRPPASKVAKAPEPVRSTSSSRAAAVVLGPPPGAPNQLDSFEAAIKLFHTRKLKEARELFLLVAEGPERDVAQRARLHVAMCDRRLQHATVDFGSAEDYYNYGVALLNTRNVSEARTHLEKALEIAPGSDHIHYALALAQALAGDFANAHANLKRAIELEPRNRIMARQDVDFAPLANQPPFEALLYPEKKSW
ncbi:MAG: tetratricopeptide repeat protein [Acidobacteriia bacterium]|nr:tetratricopeptide repeat protein [Terriglobia bacterium]